MSIFLLRMYIVNQIFQLPTNCGKSIPLQLQVYSDTSIFNPPESWTTNVRIKLFGVVKIVNVEELKLKLWESKDAADCIDLFDIVNIDQCKDYVQGWRDDQDLTIHYFGDTFGTQNVQELANRLRYISGKEEVILK